MGTQGSFNAKNPTIKRILKEAQELSVSPSPDYHAAPLETNLFEWHFTLRGPPSSAFASGLYHGRIVLPPTYPLRPPSFRFLTPSGRFEVNREICLSISGFHEESWQPAWGLRTAIVALRSFMETEAKGQLGGVEASAAVRERLGKESKSWKCSVCGGKSNETIIQEVEAAAKEQRSASRREEEVPEGLRLGYKDELVADKGERKAPDASSKAEEAAVRTAEDTSTAAVPVAAADNTTSSLERHSQPIPSGNTATASRTAPGRQASAPATHQMSSRTTWMDKAILGVAVALAIMLLRKLLP